MSKNKYAISLVVGLILLAISLAMFFVHGVDPKWPAIIQFFGLYLVFLSIFRYAMYRKSVEIDERIRRTQAFAAYYALILSMVGLIVLIEMNYLGYLQIAVTQLLYLIGLLITVPFIVFYAYFRLKGDAG